MNQSDCLEPWKPPLPNIDYEPMFAPFLEMSGGLMKLIARSSDEKSIEVMIESIAQKSTTWSTVLQLFMHNVVSILIFVSGFLLALTVLLGCVCTCIFRSSTASRVRFRSNQGDYVLRISLGETKKRAYLVFLVYVHILHDDVDYMYCAGGQCSSFDHSWS
ncbi:unnamed protein product [Haemonchus placei]|uniref:Transmembrane protein n=1 Tax=Haemonchus placei TaxID=6290 RepID=A0A0N4WLJ4_HAEPC|nr:unnamed protein product [Haemonchus placei]